MTALSGWAAINELRAFGSAAMARTVKNRRRSKIVVDTVYKILVGRCAHRTERAWLLQRIMDGAEFDDLVAAVAATDESVDRMTAQMRSAAQARLRKDFERDSEGSAGLATKRVVFMHMMKTGGTSLSKLCSTWTPPGRSRIHLYIDDLLLMPPALLARLDFVGGHIPYEALDLIPGSYSTVTILREPVSRAISHFLTLRGSGPPYQDLTLDEFTSSDVYHVPSSNYQARQLAHRIGVTKAWISYSPYARLPATRATDYPVQSLFDSTPIGASEDELLDRARRNLAGIDFVGVTDDLNSLAAQMAQCFNVALIDVPRLNRSQPYDSSQLTEAVRKRLENHNALDQELYQLARTQPQASRAPPVGPTG